MTTDTITSGWTIALRNHAWVWLLVVVAVGGVAWYLYRHTVPPVSQRWRTTLRTLRILALAVILVAALGPRLEWQGVAQRKPRVAVLVDQSESLSFADREGERPAVVRRVIEGPGLRRVYSQATIAWQGFAQTVSPLDPKALAFTGDGTAIGNALLEQRRRMPSPDNVILITDGANTTGPDPVRAAEEIGLPIYVIGVGDANLQADARIVGVSAPEISLAGKPVTVTATVENVGLARRPAAVRIMSRGTTIAEQRITLPGPGARMDVELSFVPAVPGVVRSLVVLDSIPGEILAQNNIWPFTTHVLKARHRVLVLAGAPSADVAFWMRFFRARDDLDARLWVAPRPPHGISNPPALLDSLDEVDLILWHDVLPNALSHEAVDAIAATVHGGAGLLVVPGKNGLPHAWSAMVPVEIGVGRYLSQGTQALFAPNAAHHPIFTSDADFAAWSLGWGALPPLVGRVVGLTAKTDGVVLLTGESDPLAVVGTYGAGRVVVFGGLSYWRWDMVPRGLGEPNPVGSAFWNAVVRWLGARQELSRVRIRSDAPLYRLGEPVRLIAQVYDERYVPLDGADVRIDVDEGRLAVLATAHGEGRYVAEVSGLGSGDHTVKATATANGVALGSSTTEFSITIVGLEHEQPQQQRELLEAVARTSGGGYVPASRADSLLASIPLELVPEERERTIPIGSSGWLLWAAIGLLTVEWVSRRVLGLL